MAHINKDLIGSNSSNHRPKVEYSPQWAPINLKLAQKVDILFSILVFEVDESNSKVVLKMAKFQTFEDDKKIQEALKTVEDSSMWQSQSQFLMMMKMFFYYANLYKFLENRICSCGSPKRSIEDAKDEEKKNEEPAEKEDESKPNQNESWTIEIIEEEEETFIMGMTRGEWRNVLIYLGMFVIVATVLALVARYWGQRRVK